MILVYFIGAVLFGCLVMVCQLRTKQAWRNEALLDDERVMHADWKKMAKDWEQIALVYRQALEDIFSKSKDNWAAARAETGLGRGKVAVLSAENSPIRKEPK